MLLDQGIGLDLGPDGVWFKFALGNRPDDAKVIARRFQKDRNRTGHDDGVQDRLVAVAVNHHHIIGRHRVVPDHLVAGTGAVGDEKAVIGVEDTRRIALAFADRAVMV